MKIYLTIIASAVAALFAGCSAGPSGLESYDTSQRGPAAYAPDYTQHLNSPFEDPRRAPGTRY
jgi:PBP1b-binding outer membrane lipoprotein LpoB